ncbi:MAG TPA: chloride channel protein [Thioalkalivibrio sp.]|nr:chloride channel protein [Thioalkalivibrio sp.]
MENLRLHLSRPDALLQLSVLGALTGVLAGGVIVAFRLAIESTQAGFLPGGDIEAYEGLPLWARFALPVAGGVAIGILFKLTARGRHVVGIVHVMERLAYHQGYLSLRGLLLQFAGGALAIISGQSVGREGPGVHLGAASGSLLGQRLGLPNNTLRTLVGCGTAASIAASFNTPLAGVVFALEVVMMDYSLASFMPVILSAVAATSVSVAVFGSEPVFNIPMQEINSLLELPYILLLGVVIGGFSSGFIQLTRRTADYFRERDFLLRTTLAGTIVGLCALAFPQVMGIGYDSVNAALLGELGLGVLFGVAVFKLLATSSAVALGIPGGLIGPTLIIGAMLGGFLGVIATLISPEYSSGVGFYALLGLGAMMGATLQAPLAALTAMMELTGHPGIIFPGMLAIVTASLTSSELFRTPSVFRTLLRARGLDYRNDPVMAALRRIGVASVMDRSFVRAARVIPRADIAELLASEPRWVLVDDDDHRPVALLPAVDLLRAREEDERAELDLLKIPAERRQVAGIYREADMEQARHQLVESHVEALYVERHIAPGIARIFGVLTREQVEAAYRL